MAHDKGCTTSGVFLTPLCESPKCSKFQFHSNVNLQEAPKCVCFRDSLFWRRLFETTFRCFRKMNLLFLLKNEYHPNDQGVTFGCFTKSTTDICCCAGSTAAPKGASQSFMAEEKKSMEGIRRRIRSRRCIWISAPTPPFLDGSVF